MMPIDKRTELIDSIVPSALISPKSASSSSCSGIKRIPSARLEVKRIPTKVSTGSSVSYLRSQIPTTAINSVVNAPMNGLIWKVNPSAIPGRATCESASPTSAMRLRITKLPSSPALAATKTAVMSIWKKGASKVMMKYGYELFRCHGRAYRVLVHRRRATANVLLAAFHRGCHNKAFDG
ncbi:MAG: hypothetical protein ACD_81C00071G0001 [uncultured bacterium]|nr:MAG: hypothetical protein ACD_81C00071G0001 [uncultured bacterium]